jgi:hypothetical protein
MSEAPERGPLYNQPLLKDPIYIGGGLTQAVASRDDLQRILNANVVGGVRVVGAYEMMCEKLKSLEKELRQCQSDRQREHDLRCKFAGELEGHQELIAELYDAMVRYEGDVDGDATPEHHRMMERVRSVLKKEAR